MHAQYLTNGWFWAQEKMTTMKAKGYPSSIPAVAGLKGDKYNKVTVLFYWPHPCWIFARTISDLKREAVNLIIGFGIKQ